MKKRNLLARRRKAVATLEINAHVILLDDEDYERLKHCTWHVIPQSAGKWRVRGYDPATGKRMYMHRQILGITVAGMSVVVDHINGNPLDNRKCNLRAVTQSINQRHRLKINRNNTSGLPGVTQKANGSWMAQIWRDGKNRYLGVFDTKEEAAEAYYAAGGARVSA